VIPGNGLGKLMTHLYFILIQVEKLHGAASAGVELNRECNYFAGLQHDFYYWGLHKANIKFSGSINPGVEE
jgi:hypothetical protein